MSKGSKSIIAFCHERNETPEKPFSGKFHLRITPELHREAYVAAKHSGMLSNWSLKKLHAKTRL